MSFVPHRRLQTRDGILEYLGGIDANTYENWRKKGIVAGPVPGTSRYDVRAHDRILDAVQGIHSATSGTSALKEWEARAG